MAGLDDLYDKIPSAEIASKLGADETEVDNAVHTLVPVLLTGLDQHSSQDPEHADRIGAITASYASRGLLDAGGALDEVDHHGGHRAIATLFGGFGGEDSDHVASALAGGGAGNRDLLKRLLPIVLPIVLAYVGKQLRPGGAAQSDASRPEEPADGGTLAHILEGIFGTGSDKFLGSVLGGSGRALRDVIGGLLGGNE